MPIQFRTKTARPSPSIPTASLPDIIFMLLIFFMVTTVLKKEEVLVRTVLPDAEAIDKIEEKRLVSYLYIGPVLHDGAAPGAVAIQIDDALVDDLASVRAIMRQKITAEPRMTVSLRVDAESQTGMLMDVQQELRAAGALRINYSTKREAATAVQ